MKLVLNFDAINRRIAKELVRVKGLTPQEASKRTGVSVAEILREYEEPSKIAEKCPSSPSRGD